MTPFLGSLKLTFLSDFFIQRIVPARKLVYALPQTMSCQLVLHRHEDSSGISVGDGNYGFEVVSHPPSGVANDSFGDEHANTGLAISSALSSFPSRPIQHFWENNFWVQC